MASEKYLVIHFNTSLLKSYYALVIKFCAKDVTLEKTDFSLLSGGSTVICQCGLVKGMINNTWNIINVTEWRSTLRLCHVWWAPVLPALAQGPPLWPSSGAAILNVWSLRKEKRVGGQHPSLEMVYNIVSTAHWPKSNYTARQGGWKCYFPICQERNCNESSEHTKLHLTCVWLANCHIGQWERQIPSSRCLLWSFQSSEWVQSIHILLTTYRFDM